jgi:hypothetical protein
MPHVLSSGGWEQMRWERWTRPGAVQDGWGMEIIETSALSPADVAAAVTAWCRRALEGDAPVMHLPPARV